MLKKIIQYLVVPLGFLLWFILLVTRGAYKGSNIFYRNALSGKKNIFAALARSFLESPLAKVFTNYDFYKKNKNNQRLSDRVIRTYGSESLDTYGDLDFKKGSDKIEEQQRGLVLPLLESCLKSYSSPGTVVEIGTGNGDVSAQLSESFPNMNYVGIDFFTKNAQIKHGDKKNLTFVKGYALDLFDTKQVKGDVVFASSSFTCFTPEELANYCRLFRENGVADIILSEPCWAGHVQKNNTEAVSYHMDGDDWFHNYCGYLRKFGYAINDFKFFTYKHPLSKRPDLRVSLIWAHSS